MLFTLRVPLTPEEVQLTFTVSGLGVQGSGLSVEGLGFHGEAIANMSCSFQGHVTM